MDPGINTLKQDVPDESQIAHLSVDSNISQSEPPAELLESSHIERVSSFVRQHRNSICQSKPAWISTPSILQFKDRKSRNTSFCSSSSAGQVTDEKSVTESPERTVTDSPDVMLPSISVDDVKPEYPPETYGKLLYHGNEEVEQKHVISILGKE